jgi:phage-related protein
MAIGTLTFNGIQSDSLGLRISGNGVFNAPPKNYSMVQIPGRNGDLIIDNDRFDNIDVTYPAIILPEDYYNNKIAIRQWLLSSKGYCRLEDSYNPDEYRLACYKNGVDITDLYFEAGGLQITFNCRPERFLKSGETVYTTTNSGVTITNQMPFASKPLIKVYGYGVVTIVNSTTNNVYSFTVADQFEDVSLDCDSLICYHGTYNANSFVTIDAFPILEPGVNTITFPNTISRIDITPRWWRI